MSDTHRYSQSQWRGATNNTGTEGTESTHVLVRNDMGDVLQDQLSPPAVLVKFLEEHPRLEIPSGDRQTDVITKTRKVFLVQGWQCRTCGQVWLSPTCGNLMGIQPHLLKPMHMVCSCLGGTTVEGVARALLCCQNYNHFLRLSRSLAETQICS